MQIIYSDGVSSVTMPRTRPYTVGGSKEGKLVKLAGGKHVFEATGFRIVFTAQWDWVPQNDILALLAMMRARQFLDVTYFDPVQGVITRSFSLSFPQVDAWRWQKDGSARWHNIQITHTAQELMK